MEKYKVVAFCRVSTNGQDYARQISDLMPQIINDGYKENDVYIIKHKESAVKNDIYNRKSIQELKEVIADNEIKAVYVTEVSRLARRGDVLYQVLGLLKERNICLVVLSPMLLRTIENGRPNPMADMVITFLGYNAEQEGILRKERQASGIAQKKRDGKVTSSRLVWGYKRSKEGYAVIDEERAKIIVDAFNMYVDGNSVSAIWKKYENTELMPKMKYTSALAFISRVLRNSAYVGKHETCNYPRIVSDEIFNEVQEKLSNNHFIKSKTKQTYYCRGILYCDGHIMSPEVAQARYTYHDADSKYSKSINMNVMDSLLWHLATEGKASMDVEADGEKLEKMKEQIALYDQKIKGISDNIETISKQMERLNTLFIKGKIKEDKYDVDLADFESAMAQSEREKEDITTAKRELENYVSQKDGKMAASYNYNNLVNITDDATRHEIIKEVIKRVDVEKEGRTWTIRVQYNSPLFDHYTHHYQYINNGRTKKLLCIYGDGMFEDLTNGIENRIQRVKK